MALYAEFNTDIRVYGESTKENLKGSLVVKDKILNTLTVESSGRVSLAASASDIAFNFQGITSGKLVMLSSVKTFSFKLNGIGNPAITLKPRTYLTTNVDIPACAMLMSDAITSIHLTNPDTAAVTEVDVTVCG